MHPHVYVYSDIPEGLTLVEWRRLTASGFTPRRRILRRVLRFVGNILV